jgi:hypothetical protein
LSEPFADFLASSSQTLQDAQKSLLALKEKVAVAAQFYCEKTDSFKLEELLGTFSEFSKQFLLAIDQNVARKTAARKAAERKKAMEEMKEQKTEEGAVIDTLVARVQKGDFSRGMSSSVKPAAGTPAKADVFARAMNKAAANTSEVKSELFAFA